MVLFSYYQYKLNQTNDRVNALISGYKKQFANAESDLAAATAAAKASIQNQLKALQQIQAGPATLAALIKQVAPSVYFVHTLDANGQASVGTAFVVSSTTTQSLLLTSYTTVKAATVTPGPDRLHPARQHQHPRDRAVLGPPVRPGPAGAPAGRPARPPGRHPVPRPAARRRDLRRVGSRVGRGVDLPGHHHRRLGQRHHRGLRPSARPSRAAR